jgi:hypothetical protein
VGQLEDGSSPVASVTKNKNIPYIVKLFIPSMIIHRIFPNYHPWALIFDFTKNPKNKL